MSGGPFLPCDAEERAVILAHVVTRFGIDPSVFEHYDLSRVGRKFVMISASNHAPPVGITTSSRGIPFMRMNLKYPKLTTSGAMLFGPLATRNRIDLEAEDARLYVNGADLTPGDAQRIGVTSPGYVLVTWEDAPLGLGLLLDEDGERRLKSLYPRRWAPSPIDASDSPTRGGIET